HSQALHTRPLALTDSVFHVNRQNTFFALDQLTNPLGLTVKTVSRPHSKTIYTKNTPQSHTQALHTRPLALTDSVFHVNRQNTFFALDQLTNPLCLTVKTVSTPPIQTCHTRRTSDLHSQALHTRPLALTDSVFHVNRQNTFFALDQLTNPLGL